jgi:8-oxo-dGTP pyrophosphatase MutT (NUDIX family)
MVASGGAPSCIQRKRRFILQKRSADKDIQPGKWDTAAGGHVDYGETTEEALKREAHEELGIENFTYEKIASYVFESEIEKEFANTFTTLYSGNIRPDSRELRDKRFWRVEEIVSTLDKNIFTPNVEHEFRQIIYPLT